jgi:hypothetical protein
LSVPCKPPGRLDVTADHPPLLVAEVTQLPQPIQQRGGPERVRIRKLRVDLNRTGSERLKPVIISCALKLTKIPPEL